MKNRLHIAVLAFALNAASAFALTGSFTATVVTIDVPSDVVASWLPDEMSLARPLEMEQKVFIFMGQQKNVAHLPRYNEIIVSVPNISYRGGIYSWFPRLYLDHRGAVAWGKALYGFPKIYASMINANDVFELSNRGRSHVLLRSQLSRSPREQIDQSSGHFLQIKDLLGQQMLRYHRGRVVCSGFHIDFSRTELVPSKVDVQIERGFMPNMQERFYSSDSINNEAFGSFYMINAKWKVPEGSASCQ